MKKLILAILMIFLMTGLADAAVGTITGVSTVVKTKDGYPSVVKVVLTCTAGTAGEAGAYPVTVINTLAGVTTNLLGLSLYTVGAYPGGVAPTDNTDVTITMDGMDMLTAKGTNLIDATTTTIIWAGSAAADFPVPVVGNLTVTITGNSVASAVTTLVLIFGPN